MKNLSLVGTPPLNNSPTSYTRLLGRKSTIRQATEITLIENAFKHGINTNKACFIAITIAVKAGEGVLCTVENSLPDGISDLESKNSGIGLVNLTKRLALLYSNKHEFVAEKRAENFYCRLRIDFDKTQIKGV